MRTATLLQMVIVRRAQHRRLLWLVLGAALLLPAAASSGQADEKGESQLATRLFHVGALVAGRYDRIGPVAPPIGPDDINDEENPLFGAEFEEPGYAVGTIDRLIKLVQASVSPGHWKETAGAGLAAAGMDVLIVHARPEVLDAVARFLAHLEGRNLGGVLVEVECLRVGDREARELLAGGDGLVIDAERLARLRKEAEPGPSVRVRTNAGQRVFAFDGSQRAFVQDVDAEVAQDCPLLDPIVSVDNLGLCADVRVRPAADGRRVMVGLRGFLALPGELRSKETELGFSIDLPTLHVTRVQTRLDVPAGRWVLADGRTGADEEATWCFLLRATPMPHRAGTPGDALRLDHIGDVRKGGELALQVLQVGHLTAPVEHRIVAESNVWPSNYTPPEPPELPEPAPAVSPDTLVDLLQRLVAPGSWDEPGADMEVVNGRLRVRNVPSVLAGVERRVSALRRGLIWSVVTTAEVIEMPATLADDLAFGRADAGKGLVAALEKGEAERLGSLRVTSLCGARNVVKSGRWLSYLQDYEIEIGNKLAPPNPVVQMIHVGSVLDVEPKLASDLHSVHIALRFTRTALVDPLRCLKTPYGPLELPNLSTWRVSTDLQMPIGTPTVVAVKGEGGRRRVLLLTARLQRQSK